jgi:hypothetical protein
LTIENELGESMDYNIDNNDKYLDMFDIQQDISLKPDTFLSFKTPSETVQVLLEEFIVIDIPTPNSMQVIILHTQKTCNIYINEVNKVFDLGVFPYLHTLDVADISVGDSIRIQIGDLVESFVWADEE